LAFDGSGGDLSGGPYVELVAIGDELLLGEVADANGAWIASRLAEAGIRVARTTAVGDDLDAIRDAVRSALDRTGVVICTGGLGPTRDDVTRPAVAGLFGRRLHLDEAVLSRIRTHFEEWGLPMPPNARRQAEVPEGARILPNRRGTAPGLVLEDGPTRAAILLPGVPSEAHTIIEDHVLDYLERRWPDRSRPVRHLRLRTTGIPESALAQQVESLAETIEPLTLAFLPSPTGVDLRLSAWATLEPDEADARLEAAARALEDRLGPYVYGRNDEDLAAVLGAELARRGRSIAVAESCTAGLIAKRITDVAGSSRYFLAGIVAYANDAKERLLGVRRATLVDHGAVSAETAREMAEGVRRAAGSDYGLSVTGIAGPGGGSPRKPVGTVWIGFAAEPGSEAELFRFTGDRGEVRERAAQAALMMAWLRIRKEHG